MNILKNLWDSIRNNKEIVTAVITAVTALIIDALPRFAQVEESLFAVVAVGIALILGLSHEKASKRV